MKTRPFLATALLVAACGGGGDDDDQPAFDATLIEDAVADNLGDGMATGYSVAIWRDGEIVYTAGFGTKNAAGDPVTPDTLFQIGSDTKKVTALALLRQVDAGTIALDDTVGELVPELALALDPGHLDALTIDALLSHRSGLFDYTPWSEHPDDGELDTITRGRFAQNEYAMMPPGIAWNYANPAFSLAGFVDETLDGRPWGDIVAEDVFAPLEMIHTYARRDDAIANEADLADGHGTLLPDGYDSFSLFEGAAFSSGWAPPPDQFDNAFTRPAGLVWSTAADQARLMGFFVDGNEAVLSDDLRAEMTASQTPLLDHLEGQGYGYGILVQSGFTDDAGDYHPTTYLSHGGNTLTMSSASAWLPDERVAVSVLANGEGEDMEHVVRVALEVAAGDRLPPVDDPPQLLGPPAADLSVYAGSYTDPNLGDVTITWDVDHLTIDIPLLTQMGATVDPVLAPAALDYFVLTVDGTGYGIDFYDAPDGTPHAYGVNRAFVFSK